jgi:hypothetical protein
VAGGAGVAAGRARSTHHRERWGLVEAGKDGTFVDGNTIYDIVLYYHAMPLSVRKY